MADAASTPETMSFREFATHIGKKPGYVTQLKSQQRLVLTPDGKRVLVADSKRLIADSMDPTKAGVVARHAAARAATGASGELATDSSPSSSGQGGADGEAAEQGDGRPVPEDSPFGRRRAEAQARREEAQARKAERDEQIELGELLERAATVAALQKHIATLRTRLTSIPVKLAPELGAADESRCQALLTDEIEQALDDLERKFSSIGRTA